MQCPVDGETLLMTDRNGVEIDYCPHCRGIWLDRGELDKIIEHSDKITTARPFRNIRDHNTHLDNLRSERNSRRKKHKDSRKSDNYYLKRKTKSFLKEIFDFD